MEKNGSFSAREYSTENREIQPITYQMHSAGLHKTCEKIIDRYPFLHL